MARGYVRTVVVRQVRTKATDRNAVRACRLHVLKAWGFSSANDGVALAFGGRPMDSSMLFEAKLFVRQSNEVLYQNSRGNLRLARRAREIAAIKRLNHDQ